MSAVVGQLASGRAVPLRHTGGLGSVYTKSLRDSRRAVLIMAALLGVLMLTGGAQYGKNYTTPEARADLATVFRDLPVVMTGMYGDPYPANIESLGGLVSLKDGAFAAIVAGLWSILALSSAVASEIRSGSFELLAVSPVGIRRIVVQKVAAHLSAMALVLAVVAVASWATFVLFGSLPGDTISAEAAIGFALWVGLIGLAFGSVAFALAPFVGRASAAGIAGFLLVAGNLVNGYQASVPALSGWANLTWFGWTVRHQPLAGQFDWPPLVLVALSAIVLVAVGTEAIVRRDLGATSTIPWPKLPAATLGLGGPTARSLGERLPLALAWGAGIGLFAFAMADAAPALTISFLNAAPESLNLVRALFPNIDVTSAGGFLQLGFVQLGYIFAGFAAATLVSGWASDETGGRLELLLATPLARMRWAISSGLGLFAAIGVLTGVLAIAVGLGTVLGGGDPTIPMLASSVLGLYAAALAGVGFAIGGLFRTSVAGDAVIAVVIVTFLIDLLGPALNLPSWIGQLDLTGHLGQPMSGSWDWGGMAVCVFLAVGGLLLSAWGFGRRDIVH